MDGSLAYEPRGYNFTEETWRVIFAYESKLKSHKLFKKVNFKEGEKESFISWARYIIYAKEYIDILAEKCVAEENVDRKAEYKRVNYKLEMILNRNKYYVEKVNSFGLRFSHKDVCEFLKLLKHSMECNCLDEFLSVPDVWYIARNIRKNWGELERK